MIRRGEKGHRYVRGFRRRTSTGLRDGEPAGWELWEHDGTRYRRVGTARSDDAYRAFLGLPAHFEGWLDD